MHTNDTIATLQCFLAAINAAKVPTAIGGGVAVNAYGVKRETTDVDAFLRDQDRPAIFAALRSAGFRIGRIQPPFHYIGMLPGVEDPDVRVDLMFSTGEPETTAIANPEMREVWSIPTPVFPITLLVLAKLIAVADAPGRGSKDRADLEELYNIGAFAPEAIHYLIARFDPTLTPLLYEITEPTKGRNNWHGHRR